MRNRMIGRNSDNERYSENEDINDNINEDINDNININNENYQQYNIEGNYNNNNNDDDDDDDIVINDELPNFRGIQLPFELNNNNYDYDEKKGHPNLLQLGHFNGNNNNNNSDDEEEHKIPTFTHPGFNLTVPMNMTSDDIDPESDDIPEGPCILLRQNAFYHQSRFRRIPSN